MLGCMDTKHKQQVLGRQRQDLFAAYVRKRSPTEEILGSNGYLKSDRLSAPFATLSKQAEGSTDPAYSVALLWGQIHELKSIAVARTVAHHSSRANWSGRNWD
jgi:hypothetical protein